jgi:hypothetical protein
VAAAIEPRDEARAAMARQEYGLAAARLRETLARRPDDFETHYRLGVSASHLDLPDEAAREFEWVVAHGAATAPEVQIAREWLASRGNHGGAAASAGSLPGGDGLAPRPDAASVGGRAVGPDGVKPRLQLFLKGLPGSPVQAEYHVHRTDPQGNYRFTDVLPGEYMLTDSAAREPGWRLRVALARGERRSLDLSPSNHISVRDDFPSGQP